MDSGERAEVILETGDMLLIEPRCAHAFSALEYAQAIEASPTEFDAGDFFPRVLGSGPAG